MKFLTVIGRPLQHSAKPKPFSFPPQLYRTEQSAHFYRATPENITTGKQSFLVNLSQVLQTGQ